MFRQFKFEEALYGPLDRIPVSTQFKLDSLGVSLPLEAWKALALPERWVFCHLSIRSRGERECYLQYLTYVLQRDRIALPAPAGTAGPKKPWEDISRLPAEVAQKMRDMDLPLFWPEWIKLDDMERYTLFKLCKENADKESIRQAVQEFLGLSPSSAGA
ncbi:MAG TPA: nitrate reductase associated protein [bacterium]|nr:nitrate reductase associated protein [bacterium]